MAVNTEGLDPALRTKIFQMIAASHGKLYLTSGYRDDATQAKLYAGAVAKYGEADAGNWVAPPGHSNHNRGLAVDLGGDLSVAAQLAPQFGLVAPMSWEPWHYEMVGTRETSKPQAYTTPPPGATNPVDDHTLGSTPQFLAATLSDALGGKLMTSALGAAGGAKELGAPSLTSSAADGTSSAGGGTTTAAAGGAQTSSAPVGGGEGSVDPAQLYKMLRSNGVDPVHAAALVGIAGRESGYNPSAHNGNAGTGDDSYGLFQVNLIGGEHSQFTPQMLTTAQGSAQAGADLVKSGGLSPWGPYKGQSWANGVNLDAAAAASGGEVTAEQLRAIENEGLH